METIICPFCKERYQVKRVVEYKRYICGNCGRKHIYHNGRLVPFSMLRRKDSNPRLEVCAYCRHDFSLEDDASGEYICPFCNNVLYILPPSGEMPGGPDVPDTAALPETDPKILGGEGESPRFVEETRRNINIRRLSANDSIFGRQPSSCDLPDEK